MKKLTNKTFILLISILTIFLISILIIFNVSIYNKEYKELEDKLMRVTNTHEKFNPSRNDLSNPMFMDMEVYVVSFDIKGNIVNINNYSNAGLTEQEIINLANKNKSKSKIGKLDNLYFNKYIFSLNPNNDLIIVNNTNTMEYLISNLYKTFIIFIILELVIVYISNILTKWLTRPVEESFDKQRQFISDASHELKTPISIIMASAEALEDNPNEKRWLDNIKSESERMNKLIIDLLNLSKSDSMEQKEIYSEVNLSKLIKNKALSFESLMFESNLELNLNIEKDIMFKCNQDGIKELLSILIDNAIKHGYKKSKIEVNLSKNKELINLSVKNRGDSIPKEEQQKIFDRFYRIDKSRNRNSNRYGLGLAIAKNIVNKHNGNIFVNCKNGYTTFTIEFKYN
ncbi:MAG: HAMP domain-containing histidine kinase [Clostridium sp.]|nr:HAMP domain-containing histidine kinase [Clostridium sp.]MCM1443712.1 HAMP domain-containing histidine kinase [Candidatus Amulumruptor caecigallinarius]